MRNERGEHVRRQGVHRKSSRVAVERRASALYTVNTRVVDHGIHTTNRVDLFSDFVCLIGAAQVSNDNTGRIAGASKGNGTMRFHWGNRLDQSSSPSYM
jgi:hypothetical protein